MKKDERRAVTVDMPAMEVGQDGKATEKTVQFMMMPPRPGVCPVCAGDHGEDVPHNPRSLYYQYRFFSEHGCWPNWGDAMAHCSEETRRIWTEELKRHGIGDEELVPHKG